MIVMHNRRRSMRGLGDDLSPVAGAADAVRAAVTDATSTRHAMFSPSAMRAMRTTAPLISDNDAIRRALRTNVTSQDVDTSATPECPCLVSKLEAHAMEIGSPLTAANLAQAQSMCMLDPVQFQRVMVEGMGITLGFRDLDPCRPWYMRRTTWGIAAVIGVIGVVGAVAMRRRRK